MKHNLRPEVLELIRVAEKLIGFAHREKELNDDECAAVVYYAQELERELLPFCKKQHNKPPDTPAC